jgi:hypothetical protein
LIHSSAYHPQPDNQIDQVNQILEDMLHTCVIEYPGCWDKNLPWAEFSYNNSYHESLKMAPFEVLYRRRCRIPLNRIEPGNKMIFGPDLVEEGEKTVSHIQDNLRAACHMGRNGPAGWPGEAGLLRQLGNKGFRPKGSLRK